MGYVSGIDLKTHKVMWKYRVGTSRDTPLMLGGPMVTAGGQSTPMSYAEGGRQYIVTAAGGHGSFKTKLGDYVIAYALP